MPCYHFNVRDGDALIEDPDGSDLPDLEAARAEALASACEILAERLRAGALLNGQTIEIADAAGAVLDNIPLRDALRLS